MDDREPFVLESAYFDMKLEEFWIALFCPAAYWIRLLAKD